MALRPKQQRFIQEYLIDLNATQAAIRAGYSKKTAMVIGHENLKKPEIAAALEVEREKAATKAECSRDEHLAELARLRQLAEQDGNVSAAIKARSCAVRCAGTMSKKRK